MRPDDFSSVRMAVHLSVQSRHKPNITTSVTVIVSYCYAQQQQFLLAKLCSPLNLRPFAAICHVGTKGYSICQNRNQFQIKVLVQ